MTTVIPIRFSGTRVTVFPFVPENGATEQLTWRTNIMPSRDQSEQRHAVRERPRQEAGFLFAPETPQLAAQIRNTVRNSQDLNFAIPEVWDLREMSSPDNLAAGAIVIPVNPDNAMYFPGRSVLFILPDGSSFDRAIDTVQAGTSITLTATTPVVLPVGSILIPLGTGFVKASPRYNDNRINYTRTRISFTMTSTEDLAFSDAEFTASAFEKHPVDGLLVMSEPNVVNGNYRTDVEQNRTIDDSGVGLLDVSEVDAVGLDSRQMTVFLATAAEIWQWKRLLYYLAGSWRSFYLPTYADDLPLNVPMDLASTSFTIHFSKAAVAGFAPPHRDVFIELSDGRTFTRRVTNIVDNQDGSETVSLNAAPAGVTELIQPEDARISWNELVRIDGDSATFIYERLQRARLRFSVKGVVV